MEEMDHQTISPSKSPRQQEVRLKVVDDNLQTLKDYPERVQLRLNCDPVNNRCIIEFHEENGKDLLTVRILEPGQVYQCGSNVVMLRIPQGSAVVTLDSQNDTSMLLRQVHSKKLKKQSVFSLRTEESSANQYFQFYGYLSQQQNMMQDYVRTSTYQAAMLQNTADFANKVVMDVGAGSGILSFFAVQAGAKKVYAIEASSMAVHCQRLVKANQLSNKIIVIAGKVEEIDVPEMVDVIISEPMGYMLFNERMLESYVHARKWLKPEGKMYPTQGILYCAPFNDDMLYMEQFNKVSFWCQQHFHAMDLSSLREAAMEEYFKQPVVDTFDVRILMAKPIGHTVDFRTIAESSLHTITIPVTYKLWSSGSIHGMAFWFDVSFIGTQQTVWLSTAPFQPITHWYQVRCLLQTPLFASAGQEITGHVYMKANERQSYDIDMEIKVIGTSQMSRSSYDLKNPNFRYTGIQPQPPAGSHHTNPTESYWTNSTSQHNPYSSPQQQFMAAMMNGGGGIGPPVSPSYASAYSAGSYQTAGGYPTTSMYGHPLMTPVITGGAGSVSGRQMWYPDQSSTYNSHGHMYYQKSPGSRQSYSPLPNHS